MAVAAVVAVATSRVAMAGAVAMTRADMDRCLFWAVWNY